MAVGSLAATCGGLCRPQRATRAAPAARCAGGQGEVLQRVAAREGSVIDRSFSGVIGFELRQLAIRNGSSAIRQDPYFTVVAFIAV